MSPSLVIASKRNGRRQIRSTETAAAKRCRNSSVVRMPLYLARVEGRLTCLIRLNNKTSLGPGHLLRSDGSTRAVRFASLHFFWSSGQVRSSDSKRSTSATTASLERLLIIGKSLISDRVAGHLRVTSPVRDRRHHPRCLSPDAFLGAGKGLPEYSRTCGVRVGELTSNQFLNGLYD